MFLLIGGFFANDDFSASFGAFFLSISRQVVTMNEQNLIRPEDLTPSERRENASKAGKASGAARRRKRDIKQCMQLLLSLPASSEDDWAQLVAAGVSLNLLSDDEITNLLVVNAALLNRAKQGDVSAVKELRSILGDDERIKIERERLKLEKEKLQQELPGKNGVNIVDDI